MRKRPLLTCGAWLIALLLITLPEPVWACATCFGASDSNLARGMNMGIFSLLAVITCVLGGLSAFFVFLAKRASQHPEPERHETDPATAHSK